MLCEKCKIKISDMTFDFTQNGKNPNGKLEHICSDCWNSMIRRYKND
jgi:hypothetical protein